MLPTLNTWLLFERSNQYVYYLSIGKYGTSMLHIHWPILHKFCDAFLIQKETKVNSKNYSTSGIINRRFGWLRCCVYTSIFSRSKMLKLCNVYIDILASLVININRKLSKTKSLFVIISIKSYVTNMCRLDYFWTLILAQKCIWYRN